MWTGQGNFWCVEQDWKKKRPTYKALLFSMEIMQTKQQNYSSEEFSMTRHELYEDRFQQTNLETGNQNSG